MKKLIPFSLLLSVLFLFGCNQEPVGGTIRDIGDTFEGNVTGNVTGNVAGNLTGDVIFSETALAAGTGSGSSGNSSYQPADKVVTIQMG